jgi:membrane protein
VAWLHFIKFCRKLLVEIGADDLSGRAAEMAYKFFLALFPFVIFLVAMGGFAADIFSIRNPADQLLDEVGTSLPDDASSLLRTQVENVTRTRNPTLVSLGIIGSIWAASSGIGSVMKALNIVLETKETRGMIKRYATAVGLTIVAGLFICASVVVMFAGQAFGDDIMDAIGLSGIGATLVLLLRYVFIAAMVTTAVAFVYWAAPAVELPFKWITPGSVVFVVMWLLFTYVFGLYVTNFGSYNATYGALGGVVILLIWIYFSSFIFLIGAEINAVLAHRESPEAMAESVGERNPSMPGRVKKSVASAAGKARRFAGACVALVPLIVRVALNRGPKQPAIPNR